MTFENTITELNVFCAHENAQIAEYAQKMVQYAQALHNGEISQVEYNSLVGDAETLQSMAKTADEQTQVVKIFQCVCLIPSLL
jgi:hypothetical protein